MGERGKNKKKEKEKEKSTEVKNIWKCTGGGFQNTNKIVEKKTKIVEKIIVGKKIKIVEKQNQNSGNQNSGKRNNLVEKKIK